MPIWLLLGSGQLRRDVAGLVQRERRRVHLVWPLGERLHHRRLHVRQQRGVRIRPALRERQLCLRRDLVPDGLLLGYRSL